MKKILLYCSLCVMVAGLVVGVYVERGYGSHRSQFSWTNGISDTFHNLSAVKQAMEQHTDITNDSGFQACLNAGNSFAECCLWNGGTVEGSSCIDYTGINWVGNGLTDYNEVCVYCHTPHGASGAVKAPIWNRTINPSNYSLYQSPTIDTGIQPQGRPGAVSIACLSCHDGTIAVDSIINIGGSGGHNPNRETVGRAGGTQLNNTGCLSCHTVAQKGNYEGIDNLNAYFDVYWLDTDLTNDHPIGMRYPNEPQLSPVELDPKFNQPTNLNGKTGSDRLRWFDEDGDAHADDWEIKLWGGQSTVECASCHNPHGTLRKDVPACNPCDNSIIRPFLRKDNNNGTEASPLCLTCHIK